jgi:A/G-specific adenine glycosylase
MSMDEISEGAEEEDELSATRQSFTVTTSPHTCVVAAHECTECRREFTTRILDWWRDSRRRVFPWREQGRTDYHLALAEVLLQQTQAERVALVFPKFIDAFPNWHALAGADLVSLEQSLRPLGLQRRRAVTLVALATAVLKLGALPDSVEELTRLPGMGQYIGRMVALQRGTNVRVGAIDVNIARVLERVFGQRTLADIRYDPYLQELALALLPQGRELEYTLAILDFAAGPCRARTPSCGDCPIELCRSRIIGQPSQNSPKLSA